MLRIIADKVDDLPEGLRAAAKMEGDKLVVSELAEGWAIEDVSGLKKTLGIELDKRKQLERQIKSYEGLDPEAAAEAREALDKLRAGQLKGSKEIDEYKSQVEKKMAEERAALQAKLDARTKALRDRMVQGELAPVIAKLGGGEAMDAILTLASQYVRVEEDAQTGALKHSIVDRDGKTRITKRSGSGDPMGFEELIEEMRNASATRGLFRAMATGGSGGNSQTGESGRAVDSDINTMSSADLIARGLHKSH